MNSSKSRGFTLIELVVVITILGILAAFAVPRFIALDSQARIATVNGLAGAAKSAAALARSLAMATGNPAAVAMEGAAAPAPGGGVGAPGFCAVASPPPGAAGTAPRVAVNIVGC